MVLDIRKQFIPQSLTCVCTCVCAYTHSHAHALAHVTKNIPKPTIIYSDTLKHLEDTIGKRGQNIDIVEKFLKRFFTRAGKTPKIANGSHRT